MGRQYGAMRKDIIGDDGWLGIWVTNLKGGGGIWKWDYIYNLIRASGYFNVQRR